MSKKNRNRSRKQRKQANRPKKSIDGTGSSHQVDECNQKEIIRITNANNEICKTIGQNFSLESVWFKKKNSLTKEKTHLDEDTYLFINIKLRLFDSIRQFDIRNIDLCISKIYYRFDLILDLLVLIPFLVTRKQMLVPIKSEKKKRPGYIIERDCHIFGGCVEEEAQDEFFISSGAVYQSWPYVYEPGFKMTPLVELINWPLSKSVDGFYSNQCNVEYDEEDSLVEHEVLPSYSIENFGINLINYCHKKKRRKNWNSNGSENSYDSSTDECFYEDSDSDDSESIIAYKKRHAIGLNSFDFEHKNNHRDLAKCHSVSRSHLPKNKRVMFFSQKRCNSNEDSLCSMHSNQEFYSFKRNKMVLSNKYSSSSSDNLIF